MIVPNKLKSIRELLGLNQSQMADLLGLKGQSTYSSYEKGARGLPLELLTQSVLSDINTEWLITDCIIPGPIYYRFKKARVDCDVSIETLAKKIDKPEVFIEAIEEGHLYPSDTFIDKVGDALGLTKDWILAPNPVNSLLRQSPREIHEIIKFLKDQIKEYKKEIKDLTKEQQEELKQRDREIGALLNELDRLKKKGSTASATQESQAIGTNQS